MTTTTEVPASTRIRTRSVANVDTDRLTRRLEFLRVHLTQAYLWAEQKGDFIDRVRECVNIERELQFRNECFAPVTDGRHLMHDVTTTRTIGPRPGRKETLNAEAHDHR